MGKVGFNPNPILQGLPNVFIALVLVVILKASIVQLGLEVM